MNATESVSERVKRNHMLNTLDLERERAVSMQAMVMRLQ